MAKKADSGPHQIAARVTGKTFHTLTSIASILGQGNADVIENALAAFAATLPAPTRRAIVSSRKASQDHCPTCSATKR
jgi:hypothetical protein